MTAETDFTKVGGGGEGRMTPLIFLHGGRGSTDAFDSCKPKKNVQPTEGWRNHAAVPR